MSKISVVIPVYNAGKFLKETLTSIKDQTFSDFECVIVNDGSTDNSIQIINEFVLVDGRFKCFTIDNNGCADIPIKHGVRNSTSDLIMVIGHDDYLESKCLDKMYQKQLETNADIVLLRLIGCLNELDGELYRLPLVNFEINKIYSGTEACSLTIGGWKITCNGMLVKKILYDEIPEGRLMNSDEISSRYLLYKALIVVFVDAIYYYRNHSNSISRALSPRLFEKLTADCILDNFVSSRYQESTDLPKQMRNARFFNLIYLQSEFFKYIKCFNKTQRSRIREIIRESYKSQNFTQLKQDLPKNFVLLFLSSFQLFRINSFIYRIVKGLGGSQYILK